MTSRVLELARECGAELLVNPNASQPEDVLFPTVEALERFAALIAQEAKAEGAAEQRAKDVAICHDLDEQYPIGSNACADAIAAQAGGKEVEGG